MTCDDIMMALPIELIKVGDEPVMVRINGHEFSCEEGTHNTVVPKRFLARVRLSEIPDEITIKPVKSIEGKFVHVDNDIEVSAFHDGFASILVEEMFRRKFWDGDVGLSPYATALREAIGQRESASETDFDDDDDYVFVRYEITVTEDLEILGAVEFVDSEIEHIHERADQLVHRRRDGLLGIFDRGSFNVDLRYALGRTGPVALVMVDIDHFKKVNDRFGHPTGDAVLRAVAKILSSKCEGHHRVEYRYGGEELAIVVAGDDATNAPELAEEIRADVAGLRFDTADLKVTVSLGVAQAGEDRDDGSLVRRADAALYQAKKGGRNRVEKDSGASLIANKPVKFRSLSHLVLLVIVVSAAGWFLSKMHRKVPKSPLASQPPIQAPAVGTSTAIKRTYLLLDGRLHFPQDVAAGGVIPADGQSLLPERNFHEGDKLFFNYWYKAVGPNPVQVYAGSRWVYLKPSAGDDVQQEIVKNFEGRLKKEWKDHPHFAENYTLMHEGDSQWNTAFAYTEDGKDRIVKQKDLDDIKTGAVRVLLVIQIPYKDNGEWHYLRTCLYLVPPATVPAVWHFCDYFTNSD